MSDSDYYGPMRTDPSGQTPGIYSGNTAGRYDPFASTLQRPYYDNSAAERNWGSSPVPTSAQFLTDRSLYGQWQGLQAGNANAGVQRAQLQGDIAGYGIGIGAALASQKQETGYLNQDYDIGKRRLANEQGRLDVDLGTNARQPGVLNALHDIAGKQYGLQREGATAGANQARRGLESALTARGAFTSVGGQQGRFDIASDLLRQTQGINLNQQGETVNYFEDMAKVGDQKKKLDLMGKDLGLSGEQLNNELQRGLERLNLSTGTSVADLLNKINSGNLQDAAIAQQIVNNALQNSDYYARLYPGQNANDPQVQAIGGVTDVPGSATPRRGRF